ncbi:MAG: serpin family protein [Planctomycetes bacterium]|nr:serpin family protein [Planctomycetota bacterium]
MQHRLGTVFVLSATAGLITSGCCALFGEEETHPAPGQEVKSSKARVTSPVLPEGDLDELVTGNTAFALNLYQQVRSQDGNVFFSPHSISLALAMTYAGARTETEQQMADALKFTLPQERLHAAFSALDQELASRGAGDGDSAGFRLNIVNRIWGQTGYSFLEAFLDTLAENYGAGLNLLDFVNQLEQSRIAINEWVSQETKGKIKDLIPAGALTSLTRLVLTNAIYFKAAWAEPFEESATADGSFTLLDGSPVTVPMMTQVAGFRYAAGDGYQAIELPYEGRELSMVVLLPDAGNFEAFEVALDAVTLQGIVDALAAREIRLTTPRFTFEWSVGLTEALSMLGMPLAFSANADFSGMDGTHGLLIQDVLHKAFVAVDEEGTEAAAATAVIVGLTAVPPPALSVTVDRPFVFLIRDVETGAILFLGRVVNPAS